MQRENRETRGPVFATPRAHRARNASRYVCMTQHNKWKHLLPSSVFTYSAAGAAKANNGGDTHFSRCDASRVLCGWGRGVSFETQSYFARESNKRAVVFFCVKEFGLCASLHCFCFKPVERQAAHFCSGQRSVPCNDGQTGSCSGYKTSRPPLMIEGFKTSHTTSTTPGRPPLLFTPFRQNSHFLSRTLCLSEAAYLSYYAILVICLFQVSSTITKLHKICANTACLLTQAASTLISALV